MLCYFFCSLEDDSLEKGGYDMEKSYNSSPDHTTDNWPKGIKYIVGNEGCERFSYYGMKAILWLYLVQLYKASGENFVEDLATQHIHLFSAATYGMGLIGAVLAEKLLGKYKTILWLSIVYCFGHAALAMFERDIYGTHIGLTLIAIGSGGIKPCVSAHVGDQFGRKNWFRLASVYQVFYFIINFGSFFSTLFIPLIKEHYGYSVAFGIPGVLMAIATVFFWMGRKVFIHVPARPGGKLGFVDASVGTLLSASLLVPLILKEALHLSLFFTTSFSVVSFVLGLALFTYRQKKKESDGFLAIILTQLDLLATKRNLNLHQILKEPQNPFVTIGFGEEQLRSLLMKLSKALMLFLKSWESSFVLVCSGPSSTSTLLHGLDKRK